MILGWLVVFRRKKFKELLHNKPHGFLMNMETFATVRKQYLVGHGPIDGGHFVGWKIENIVVAGGKFISGST